MKVKVVVGSLVLVLLVGLVWTLGQLLGGEVGPGVGPGAVAGPSVDQPRPDEQLESGAAEVAEPPAAPARVAAAPSGVTARAASWKGELAGLTGRVVEADGTPVPAIAVALIEVDTGLLFAGNLEELGEEPPSLELEETHTDGEGRFLLSGARAQAFHGLGIDLGGGRATLRVLDSSLKHGQLIDVGDVVLAPFGVLSGRVVDEQGAGVGGARVRAAPIPEEALESGLYDLRAESLLAVTMLLANEDGRGLIELPSWIRHHVDRLPVATTHTAADGTFRLQGVALGEVIAAVDKPGWAGLPLEPMDLPGGEHDLGDLLLSRGRTVEGLVQDLTGEPVEGIEVYAGAEVPLGMVAILQPAGRTDEAGRFALSGVPAEGQLVACARRTPSEPWSTVLAASSEELVLEIETALELEVRVQNEAGEPLSGARIGLMPGFEPDEDRFGFADMFMFLPRATRGAELFQEVEAGLYRSAAVTPGLYEVSARVAGYAPGFAQVEVWEGEAEVQLTCPQGRKLTLTVLDAATREPVAGARASILRVGYPGLATAATGRTDEQGQVVLGPFGPLEPGGERDGRGMSMGMPREQILRVQHPRYAEHSAKLEQAPPVLEVRLDPGGSLTGRIHWGGAVPTRPYMLMLMYRDANGFLEAFHMPRMGLSDLTGAFRFDQLVAGEYRLEVFERFLDQDAVGMIDEDFEPNAIYRETVEIHNGQESEVTVDLSPSGKGPTARILGSVRVDGAPVAGAEVNIWGGQTVRTQADEWGAFDTGEFSILQDVWLDIEGEVPNAGGGTSSMELYSGQLELQAGEVRQLDLDLVSLSVRLRAVSALTGAPIPGANFAADLGGRQSWGNGVEADSTGEADLVLLNAGEVNFSADAPGFIRASRMVEVPAGGLSEVIELELSQSVPCAGRVELGGAAVDLDGWAYIYVRSEDGKFSTGVGLDKENLEFEFDDLGPGSYGGWIWIDNSRSEPIAFVLGPAGDTNLVLEYVPEQD